MNPIFDLKLFSIAAALVWSGLLGGFFYYDVSVAKKHVHELAIKEARSNFSTNQALRLWVVRHGGVYAPVDEKTPPNPALAHIPERDIVTPSGKQLTLMNSAYVLRQLMDEFGELHGVKGKLTSFKPLNPNNAPDPWESEVLRQFEAGKQEVFDFSEINGQPYLRLMSVMLVEEGCLKCHAAQGYKVGDVRGGASLSVPMRPYLEEFYDSIRQKLLIYLVIWLTGLIGIAGWTRLTGRRLREKNQLDARIQEQHKAIEQANAELTHFANISAHHLMEPARRLLSFTQRLRKKLDHAIQDPDVTQCLDFIEQGATRMRDLIRDIERYLAAGMARAPLRLNSTEHALTEALRRLAPLIESTAAKIEVQTLAPVYLDMPRLIDLFEVLLANALIHAKTDKITTIRISGQNRQTVTRLRIEDNGPGIEPQYQERVFGVFEQLKPNPLAGTGIGLAIARRIIESRSGEIWIETPMQGGTAVVFDLPIEDVKK